MEAAQRRAATVEEYLALEESSDEKHEYFEGEIFAMSGGSFNHSQLPAQLALLLGMQLRKRPCRVVTSDLRVRVEAVGLYTYPDLAVVCGEPRLSAGNTLDNPTLLVEVLSPSTEGYDRGKKFDMYRQLPSLQQYVLVSQDAMRVHVFTRQADGNWLFQGFQGADEVIPLGSIECSVVMGELYEKVIWETATSAAT